MPKDKNGWSTDDLFLKDFDEDMQLEEFTLEDVLAEFGSGGTKHPLQKVEIEDVEIFDDGIFEEILEEKNPRIKSEKKTPIVAKPTKKEEDLSSWDFPEHEFEGKKNDVKPKHEKNVETQKVQTPAQTGAETEQTETPKKQDAQPAHAVSAERKIKQKPVSARLDETLRLNEFFESEEDYDEPVEEEEYEPELPGAYVKRNALHVRNMAIRSVFAFLLCLPACYLSFAQLWGLPVPEFIAWNAHPFRFLLALSGLHLIAISLHMSIVARGLKKLFTFRADLFSMIALSSVATLAHAGYMMIERGARHTMPFSAVSIMMLFFAGYGLYLRESARLRACKAASGSKEPLGVFISERDTEINLIKHPVAEIEPFTKYVQMPDGADRFWTYLAPILIVGALVFAGISSFGRGDPGRFFWAFAAIMAVSTPFFVLLCYPLPFSKITKRLSQLGAALAGWYAAFSLSGDRNLIIRDIDIFPKGSVTLHGLKVFGNHSLEKAVSYATSMIHEAKSGLAPVFGELLKSQYGKCEHVYHLLHHESGGMEADVCGDHVLLGTAGFMLRMGIRISEKSNVRNAMFLAINGSLAAVFNLNYKLSHDVRVSLESVIRSRVKPVMAVIDCNQNPVMLESELHVRAGSIEYPRIEERLDLASEEQFLEYDPCAFITRSGLAPFASAVLTARRLRKVTVRNVILSTVCAIIGMLLMFYITFVGSYESGAAYNVFLYLLLWTLPVYLLSVRSGAN